MSLFYGMVFYLLVAELLFTLTLVLPLPLSWKQGLWKRLSKFKQIKSFLRVSLLFISLLFIDALRKSFALKAEGTAKDPQSDAYFHAKMFYAQRNIYLTGSTIVLALVLNRFLAFISDLVKQEEKTLLLKSQSTKTRQELLKLVESESDKDFLVTKLKEQVTLLESKVKDYDILKKQAESLNKEYMILTDKISELESLKQESKKSI
jgi:hypothetical protein